MIQGISKFLNEVKSELAKVVWPTKKELIGSTIISLIFIFVFTVYLGALDYIFRSLVERIF